MNGVPVSPSQKSENAPTWRPRKHNFGGRFSAYFPLFSSPHLYTPHTQHPTPDDRNALRPRLIGKVQHHKHRSPTPYHNYTTKILIGSYNETVESKVEWMSVSDNTWLIWCQEKEE